jgi:hypothetical protein
MIVKPMHYHSVTFQHRSKLVAHTSKPGINWFNTFPSKAGGNQQKYLKFVVLFYSILVVFIDRFHRMIFYQMELSSYLDSMITGNFDMVISALR